MSRASTSLQGNTPLKVAALRNSAPVFAALGDETRLRLVAALCDGQPKSIAQLTAGTPISRQAVTKHLQVLSKAGLVRGVKAGRERLWEFEAARLEKARHSLGLIAEQWDQALNRLKHLVENDPAGGRGGSTPGG
jgi:DNA-binding transcriptional ArsR family regulator